MKSPPRILCLILSLLHFQLAVVAKVRGVSGVDYPNYSSVPKTAFKCPDEHDTPGFYADFETRCQVFHYCYEHRKESFLCPEGTIFNEAIKSCDYWYSSKCDSNRNLNEAKARKQEKNIYNDVPFVPVRVNTNHIFDKMAALYEPQEHTESSVYEDRIISETAEYSEDILKKGNENLEADTPDTDSLGTQEILLNELRENSQTEENIGDFVKYEHDSEEKDDVDIIFNDRSAKSSSNENDNNEVRFFSETETNRYTYRDTEEKELYQRYNSEEQTELFTTDYPPFEDEIKLSDLIPSESLLVKRLSGVPRKRRFRRKPTYVVLQTSHELDGLSAESTGYGVEENQPIKDLFADKTNVYHSLHAESPTSDTIAAENQSEDSFVQMSVRQLRRNRKTFGTLPDESDKANGEKTKLVEDYHQSKEVYVDKAAAYHPSHTESPIYHTQKIENKSEDEIKMSVQKPRRNNKTFGMFVDEPDKVIGKTTELVREKQASKVVHADKININHSLSRESPLLVTTKTENKSDDISMAVKKPSQNRKTIRIFTDELDNISTEVTESTTPHKVSMMPPNVMSPFLETDAETIILVSEHDLPVSTADTFITAQPASTQATVLATTTPSTITTLEQTENEFGEKGDEIENFSGTEESHFDFHKLKNTNIDGTTARPDIYKTELADVFERDLENNQDFVSPNINSEVEDRAYSSQDDDDIVNMNSYIEDMVYSERERNSDNIENIKSEVEDLTYLEQDINPVIVNMNSEDEYVTYSKQALNLDSTINMNTEVDGLSYPEQEMNSDVIVANILNSHDIYNEILSSKEQADQYDNRNNYKTIGSLFTGGYSNNIYSQPIEADINNNNYVKISTLSPITTTDYSSAVSVLDEDNEENILVYDNLDSFEDGKMSGVEYEHVHYTNNVNEMNLEHEEEKSIDSDRDTDISEDDEEETKSFPGHETDNFDSMLVTQITSLPDYSSAVNVLDEDKDESILVYNNLDSFEDGQMNGFEYEDVYHTNNVNEMNSEHEEEMSIDSDIVIDISDDDKEEEKSFSGSGIDDFDSMLVAETTLPPDNVYSVYEENIQQGGLEENPDSYRIESLPLQEKTVLHKEPHSFFNFERSLPSEIEMEISNPSNNFSKESFENYAAIKDLKDNDNDGSVAVVKILEESFKSSTLINNSNDTDAAGNMSFTNMPKEAFGRLTLKKGSQNTHADKNETLEKFSEKSFEKFTSAEDLKYINTHEKAPIGNSTEAELSSIYQSADDKPQFENFEERNNSAVHTKTSKGTLKTNLQEEVDDFENASSQLIEKEIVTLGDLMVNQYASNPINTYKTTVSQTGFVRNPQNEEEKPIDSVLHSSSMPLPANIFEQDLYKQSLQQEKKVQVNKDKTYPVTFYKELDDSLEKSKVRKFKNLNTQNNKRYRTLNSNFPFGEMNFENTGDESPKYREPSILSLLEPSQTAKRLLSTNFPVFNSIFAPPARKISPPVNLKKLAAFGKNLLAFKRAKLNDFKLVFDLFRKQI